MSDTNFLLLNSKDTIISDISSSLWGLVKSRIKTTDSYLSKTGTIDFDSMNKEFKLLIEESFHEAMKGLKIETDKQADYRESILENADILLEWFQKEPYPAFNEELIEISNYDIKENIIRLFKSLHYQIQMKRDNSISSVFNRLKEISNTNTNRIMENSNRNTQLILEKLAIIQNPIESDKILNSWKISEPLKNAESLFKNRKYENAKVLLDALPINSNNITIEEREKYYEIYTNILLADHENQANAIPYLNKLIENSTNESKKTCRSILLLCIEKKYEEGLSKISLEIQNCNSSKDTLYELKINILLLKNEINTANDYIESIKDSFSKYIFWKTRILVCLGKYSEAEAIINKSKSVNTSDFDFKILKIQVIAYKFANNFSEKGFDISWNKELFEAIEESQNLLSEVNDDTSDKENLLIALSFLYRVTNQDDKLLNTYKELEKIDSHNPNFLRNYPLMLVQLNKQKEALKWFKKYFYEYPEDLFVKSIYFQVLISIDAKKALDELKSIDDSISNIQIKTNQVIAHLKLYEKPEAVALFYDLESKYPQNFFVQSTKIEILLAEEKYVEASKLAKFLFNSSATELDKYVLLNRIISIDLILNNTFFYIEDIKLIESLENDYERLFHFGEKLICLLLLTNQLLKANEIIARIRNYDLLTPNIIRNEIICNYNTQNFQMVIKLINELQTFENLTSSDNIIYLRACYALGDTDSFKNKIDSISEPSTETDYIILHQQLYSLGMKEKDIEFTHKGYKKFPESIKLKENFMDAIFGSQFNSLPEDIKKDAVLCRDEYFKIEAPNKRYKQFTLPENPTIDDLLNILNKAYPEENKIDYQKLINTNRVHISLLTVNKTNYLDIWESQSYIPEIPIYYNNSKADLLEKENKNAKANIIIIDLPTLITCSFIGILNLLPKLYEKIYISWQSINEIDNILLTENNNLLSNTYSCFYRLNNYKSSNTQIDFTESLTLAKTIKQFSKEAYVEIIGKQLYPKKSFPKKYKNFKNFIEFESLKFAYESEIPIASESAPFRLLFSLDKNAPPTFCIDSILSRLLTEKHISEMFYIKCLCKLLKHNYRWVFINHFVIFEVMKYYGFLESDELNTIFEVLSNKDIYNAIWTSEQLSILMGKIWNTSIPKERKFYWSNKIFEIYAKRNDIPFGIIKVWLKAIYAAIKTNQNKQFFLEYIYSLEHD